MDPLKIKKIRAAHSAFVRTLARDGRIDEAAFQRSYANTIVHTMEQHLLNPEEYRLPTCGGQWLRAAKEAVK